MVEENAKPRKSMGLAAKPQVTLSEEEIISRAEALTDAPYERPMDQRQTLETTSATARVMDIHISRLLDNPLNPRSAYLEAEVMAMADSIRKNGVMNPLHIATTDKPDTYTILSGHTRVRAIRQYLADDPRFDTVPAILHRHINLKEQAAIAFEENARRSEQRPVDVGLYWAKLLREGVFATAEELAGAMHTSKSTVSRMTAFAGLAEGPLNLALGDPDAFTFHHAAHINALQKSCGAETALKLAEMIVQYGLSIRESERTKSSLERVLAKPQNTHQSGGGRAIIKIAGRGTAAGKITAHGDGRVNMAVTGLTEAGQQRLIEAIKNAFAKGE
jgi:ParB family chromosome partitioning protein